MTETNPPATATQDSPKPSSTESKPKSFRKPISLQEMDSTYDRAMAATLSSAVYTDNVWMLQTLQESWEKTAAWRVVNVPENDPHQIDRACLVKNTYSQVAGVDIPPVGMAPDPLTSEPTQFCYQNGVFYFGDLACATLVERKGLQGQTVVELAFRGTEKETTGDESVDKKNLVGGFFLSAYKNLEGHYDRHSQLIDAAIQIVNDRIVQGENIQLNVSGHSLGGSMAEMFMKKDAHRIIDQKRVFAYTFGSPGIGENQSAFGMIVKGAIKYIATKLGLANDNPRFASSTFQGHDHDNLQVDRNAHVNLIQYVDPNDPVPKLGILGGYSPSGKVYFSRRRDRDPVSGEIQHGSMLDIVWHSISTYEDSRQYAFTRRCQRALKDGTCPSEPIQAVLSKFDEAKSQAVQLKEFNKNLLDSKMGEVELKARIHQVLEDARDRKGMIPESAPNSAADSKKFVNSVQIAGAQLLEKLAARRAGASEMQQVEKAMANAAGIVGDPRSPKL